MLAGLFKITGYRKNVIHKNLQFIFPEIIETELNSITNKFYSQLADITLESLKGMSQDAHNIIKRYTCISDKSVPTQLSTCVLYSQHFCNWEWGTYCLSPQMSIPLIAAAKELSNPHINTFINARRAKTGLEIIPTYSFKQYLTDNNDKFTNHPTGMIFISDQYPYGKPNKKFEVDFFGKRVQFHNGAANIAKKYNYPVLTLDVSRIRRGHYVVDIKPICINVSNLTPHEITQKYAGHLENLIRKNPHNWLLSHKRFKDTLQY